MYAASFPIALAEQLVDPDGFSILAKSEELKNATIVSNDPPASAW